MAEDINLDSELEELECEPEEIEEVSGGDEASESDEEDEEEALDEEECDCDGFDDRPNIVINIENIENLKIVL